MALDELPVDVRESTLTALRLRRPKLVRDLTDGLSTEPGLEHINRANLAGILITMLAATIRAGKQPGDLAIRQPEEAGGGELRATRRGRHLHIERAVIDAYRHRS
jgi:hypothetical protein